MTYALLTHNFRIVCFEQNKIIPREIENISDLSEVAYLSKVTNEYSITNDKKDKWYDLQSNTINRSIPNGYLTVTKAHPEIYNIKSNSGYMRVNPTNRKIDFEVETPNLWEEFRLLTIQELSALIFLVQNKWHLFGYQNIAQVNSNLSSHSQISFGELSVDLDVLLEAVCNNSNQYHDTILDFTFNINWKVYKAFLFKPAILFVLFGQGLVLDQFKTSIQSLTLIGKYSGDIFIVTNVPDQDLQSFIPDNILHKTHIIPMEGYDTFDYVGARISTLCSNILDSYQPILYSDADIVFDLDIHDFLYQASFSKQCSAQTETFHIFQDGEHTGGSLFRQDQFTIPEVHGFNAGLFLVPNMKNHKQSFQAAYKTIYDYTTIHGRQSIPFYDQSVLNYVLYKLNDFNPSPISERTQIGGKPSDFNKFDPNNPKGFVHFWSTADKHIHMKRYLDKYLLKKK